MGMKANKDKLGILEMADTLGSVSKTCEIMGCSRDSFYRFKKLYEQGGELALQEISRKKPIEKNRVSRLVEEVVVKMAMEYPSYGQLRVSNELKRKGINVSAGGVWSIWLRHELNTFQKRLQAIEVKVKQDRITLTTEQKTALEEAKKQSHQETETDHPGYLGVQSTYYVGNVKGIGHIYQQTF